MDRIAEGGFAGISHGWNSNVENGGFRGVQDEISFCVFRLGIPPSFTPSFRTAFPFPIDHIGFEDPIPRSRGDPRDKFRTNPEDPNHNTCRSNQSKEGPKMQDFVCKVSKPYPFHIPKTSLDLVVDGFRPSHALSKGSLGFLDLLVGIFVVFHHRRGG
jgi:hypothetical protein